MFYNLKSKDVFAFMKICKLSEISKYNDWRSQGFKTYQPLPNYLLLDTTCNKVLEINYNHSLETFYTMQILIYCYLPVALKSFKVSNEETVNYD